ncbi:GNAT family N-acetyltransferase [Agilicoccus flavus]|uniref:GNAT family N-acetyltransferase n=1 Tax=Agilicoccus flavus TaxID=2775968 RepID=UPI0027DA648B|nr:GNAT family N-acetyltransferase [Agilicoccus flavus]
MSAPTPLTSAAASAPTPLTSAAASATGPEPVLRETSWRDVATLAALETELFGRDAWSEASWWSELAARPRRHYLTLVRASSGRRGVGDDGGGDDEILGYAGLDLAGEVADVMTIAVVPAARGAGHGRTLLAALEDAARAAGARHVLLEVQADNAAALGLYAARGFVEISRRRRYYGDVDAVVMRLDLRAVAPPPPDPATPAGPPHPSGPVMSASPRTPHQENP